jgi:membrane protein implicated in regulation of membrane protease activity
MSEFFNGIAPMLMLWPWWVYVLLLAPCASLSALVVWVTLVRTEQVRTNSTGTNGVVPSSNDQQEKQR